MESYLVLKLLLAATVLGIVHLLITAGAARRQQNLAWAAGSRDVPMPPLTGVAARLDRSFRNYMETFPFFATAVVVAYLSGHVNEPLTVWGSVLYVVSRTLYVPIYASGVAGVRSLVWALAMLGIVLVIVASFL